MPSRLHHPGTLVKTSCRALQAEWKAAAERFIEKRGYMAAEQLRTTLQAEWQQLKAIRRRCCGSLSEVHGLDTNLPAEEWALCSSGLTAILNTLHCSQQGIACML